MSQWKALAIFWLTMPGFNAAVADEPVNFRKQIAPILAKHCVRCHSSENSKGDVSLATFDNLKSKGYVVGGDPDGSYLIELVTSQNDDPPAMPKESTPLAEAEVNLLRQWVQQGATWPDEVVVKAISKADTTWWAFQPLKAGHGRMSADKSHSTSAGDEGKEEERSR